MYCGKKQTIEAFILAVTYGCRLKDLHIVDDSDITGYIQSAPRLFKWLCV